MYSDYVPHDVLIFSFYDDVLDILLLYRFALNTFLSKKQWVELKLLRSGHRRKEPTRIERRKRKLPLVDMAAIVAEVYGAVWQLYSRRITRLWRHEITVVTKHI